MLRIMRRTLGLVLALCLCLSFAAAAADADAGYWWQQYLENPEEDLRAPGVNENGQVITSGGYLLMTSDPHSTPFLAKDLLELANTLVREDSGDPGACVGLFALGGDFSDNGLLPDLMTVLKHAIQDTSPGTAAVYTMGNHETNHSDEEFLSIAGMPRIGETAVNSDGLYYFYSFGMRENQGFNLEDIEKLAAFLESHNDGKPIFVLSHFPIHYYNSMRSVYGAGAEELLAVLNQYPQVIFTWGHNHSEADPSYATVRFPGETITYGPDAANTVDLKFTYVSLGSLRYGVNGENGVLARVNEDGSVDFRFLSLGQEPADDTVWADSSGTAFESLTAANPHVIAEVTRPVLDESYYDVIRAAQVFVDSPKVGRIPAALEDVKIYNDRFTAEEIVWSAGGEALAPDAVFDFNTAYTAAVTLKAAEGHVFSLGDSPVTGIDPVYDGPMDGGYNVGATKITVIDDTTVLLEYTFSNTVEAIEPAVSPAEALEEGHVYVLAANDGTSVSAYYRYEYQEGARRQSTKPWVNADIVIQDGLLASRPDTFELFTASYDDTGYLLWTDASLLDHGYGDQSIETLNILKASVLARMFNIDSEPGDYAFRCNWNIDENGLPFLDMEGMIVYPHTDGVSLSCVTDPAACNMRLYDLGEGNLNHYIVVGNVTAPVTGETPDAGTSDCRVVWSPADETFQPGTAYTATVEVPLVTPVADEAAAIGRMNGRDVEITFSEDGLTAYLSFTFPVTNQVPTPMDGATAVRAESLEAGKTYIIVDENGQAMTSMTTPDGLYLMGQAVTMDGNAVTGGITEEMLFTMEPGDTDGTCYIRSTRGYLIARQTSPDIPATWGIDFTEEPAMSVTFANGYLYTQHTGVSGGFNFGPNYFYSHDGHFNFSDFVTASVFSLYEVTLPD